MSKSRFLLMATLFEGGLWILAEGIGSFLHIDPMSELSANPDALLYALGGTLPLYLILLLGDRLPSLAALKNLLVDRLGKLLATMSRLEILYLGFLAGTTEEFLFRGVLQPWFEREWGWISGIFLSNLIFALVHWVTPTYALVAGLIGGYLGLSLDFGPDRNLAIPILIHSLYDIIALQSVANLWRTLELARKGYPPPP